MTDEQRARNLPQPEGDEELVERLRTVEMDPGGDVLINPDGPDAAHRIEVQNAEIARLKSQIQTVLDREADNIKRADTRLEAAEARIAELEGVLRDIRDQDVCEIALDPDWPRRIARAALTPKEQENPQ